ncbi:tRNA methyltransferase complex GCD14 subunit [Microthyrium microscopicum]|uniref:tRNA (adenine(58)-N(1))-methyltransferase catalytic subunit TRM61 n=1 Tax=Microthyrium microscopicum TaxID=703497 RepID=A0A6A6TY94_9PEZI|nr:tRNA methyltransferase complex GCD14 subunit [Microthyrium microscopicum]
MPTSSPFLTPCATTTSNTLALISLKRDETIPALLHAPTPTDPSDPIANTRFGSYPHSTLLHLPWGTQVAASNVGARERKRGKKRKLAEVNNNPANASTTTAQEDETPAQEEPAFEAAASGFAHIVPPTPETWTASLPHRTQVVYTPDASYILQRIRARPGDKVIEAGAGSGSFTHAAVRCVFNGYPNSGDDEKVIRGRVYSFEYHEPRFQALQNEIKEHGLDGVVTVQHADVYAQGFSGAQDVTAIFLDLPAPWMAMSHLTRGGPTQGGPLHSDRPVCICSFSPCIEQAQRAAAKLRELGWVDVGMAAVQQRRIEVRRERIGLMEEGLRGVTAVPATVGEALGRLRELEGKTAVFNAKRKKNDKRDKGAINGHTTEMDVDARSGTVGDGAVNGHHENGEDMMSKKGLPSGSKQQRLKNNLEAAKARKLYKEGRLTHRTEPELKTHTSYLVFGMLPPEWTEEDETKAVAESLAFEKQEVQKRDKVEEVES